MKNTSTKTISEEQQVDQPVPTESSDIQPETYIKQISELRTTLNRVEQENRNLQELYRNARAINLKNENHLHKYEDERAELIALREFVYKIKIQEDTPVKEPIEKMKKIIADKRIVLIGGHVHWVQKLKSIFPKWIYIYEEMSGSVDAKMLEGVAKGYFFTDYLSHTSYRRMIPIVRQHKISFGYLANRNVEKLIQQVYEETG